MTQIATQAAAPAVSVPELFALTDEQIIGLTSDLSVDEPAPTAQIQTQTAAPNPQQTSVTEPAAADTQQLAAANTDEIAAFKSIYPGGITEAKSAADAARQLADIDSAFFRGDATSRAQLARRMMEQDPAAFREMVSAAVRLLGETPSQTAQQPQQQQLHAQTTQSQQQTAIDPQLSRGYANFEQAANADLERSVGASIDRTLQQALPNLRQLPATADGAALPQRLASAVREEIDTALRSDTQLGNQISKILEARRFDDSSRAQVVRLIDTRAQQLVPTAVRRVVNTWTQTALGARRPENQTTTNTASTTSHTQSSKSAQQSPKSSAQPQPQRSSPNTVDYRRLSDEQILDL
jgi:hypothetical protein